MMQRWEGNKDADFADGAGQRKPARSLSALARLRVKQKTKPKGLTLSALRYTKPHGFVLPRAEAAHPSKKQADTMIETPQITRTSEQHTACIHLTIPREEMMHLFGPAIEELVAELTAQGIPPQGSAFAHHLKMTPGIFDFEVGFTTAKPVKPSGRMKPGAWPAQKVAQTVYHGPYVGLPGAWGEFTDWMEANKLAQAEDLWEHYVTGPHSSPDPATWRTALYRPLKD
jgi:effector-binding domain-containing protein